MAGVTIEWRGAPEIAARIRAITDPAHKRDMLDEIGASLVASTRHRFEQQRGPDGTPWKPSRRAELQGGKTLIDSARLFQSITHNVLPSAAVEVGTNVIYAGIHQFGGAIKAKGGKPLGFRLADGAFRAARQVEMPARPFLGVDADDEAEIGHIVSDWIAGAGQ